jgi:hypothetical protein
VIVRRRELARGADAAESLAPIRVFLDRFRRGPHPMPTEPADFDPHRCSPVLRLRCRDWVWPSTLLLAAAMLMLGAIEPPRFAGSMGTLFDEYGPVAFGVLLAVTGVRWCWVGRLRGPRPDRCGGCGYAMTGLDPSDESVRCPECGADGRERRATRPVPLARVLLDLPGVLAFLAGAFIAVGWATMLSSGLLEV